MGKQAITKIQVALVVVLMVAVIAASGYWLLMMQPKPLEEKVTLRFVEFAAGVTEMKAALAEFERQYPNLKVNFETYGAGDPYYSAVSTMFVAKEEIDIVRVETWLGEWAKNGWVIPLTEDKFPGVEKYRQRLYPGAVDYMSYKGQLYGLPSFGGTLVLCYNEEILQKAGVDPVFKTWDDFTAACLKIKEKTDIKYPLFGNWEKAYYGFPWNWYHITASMGGRIMDENYKCQFAEGQPAYRALQWMVDAVRKHRIVDPASIEGTWTDVRDLFHTRKIAFEMMRAAYLSVANNASVSRIAGNAKFTLMPETHGQLAWTTLYCISSTSKHKDQAWTLLKFLGGEDKYGKLFRAKANAISTGGGIVYPELYDDPDVIAKLKTFLDVKLLRETEKYGVSMSYLTPCISEAWYIAWATEVSTQGHKAILGEVTVRQALDAIESKINQLKAK